MIGRDRLRAVWLRGAWARPADPVAITIEHGIIDPGNPDAGWQAFDD